VSNPADFLYQIIAGAQQGPLQPKEEEPAYDPSLSYTERESLRKATARRSVATPDVRTSGADPNPESGSDRLMGLAKTGLLMAPGMAGARAAESFAAKRLGRLEEVPKLIARGLGAGAGEVVAGKAEDYLNRTPTDERMSMLDRFGRGAAGEALGYGIESGARVLGAAGSELAQRFGVGDKARSLRDRLLALTGADPRQLPLRDEAEAIGEAQDMLRGQRATLTADQALPGSPGMQRLGGFAAPTGPVQRAHLRSSKVGEANVRRVVEEMGARDPRLVGEAAQRAAENAVDVHRAVTRQTWQRLEGELAGIGSPVTVDIRPLWETGAAELERAGINFRPGLRRTAGLIQREGTPVTDELTGLTRNTPTLSFEEAQDLRAALREAAESRDPMVGVNQGLAGRLLHQLDEQIDGAEGQLQAMGRDDIVDLYHEARGLTRMGHTKFNNQFIRNALESIEPERVYEGFVKRGSPSRISMMRRIYEDGIERGAVEPTAWRDVQARYLDDTLRQSARPDGTLDPDALAKNVNRLGPEALTELFAGNRATIDGFNRAVRGYQLAERASTVGSAMSVNIMQTRGGLAIMAGGLASVGGAGAAGGYAAGGTQGAVAGGIAAPLFVLAGPRALGAIWSDPVFVDHLVRGWATEAGTIAGSRVAGRLLLRAQEIKEKEGLSDAEMGLNPKLLEQLTPQGELVPTVQDVAVANRPSVRVDPAAQRLGLLFGR
jgi:hypothetical protein